MRRGFQPRRSLRIFLETVRGSEVDDDGFLGIQIDADGQAGAGDLEARVRAEETHHLLGFFSRPLDPDVDDSGQVRTGSTVLYFEDGSEAFTIPLGDCRVVPALATAQKGESFLYGAAAGNFVRCHADGRVSRMSTVDGTKDGQTLFDEMGPAGYVRKTPWGALRDDATGFHYRHASGARLDIGFIGGLPAPFDQFTSYVELEAHSIRLSAGVVQVGLGAGGGAVALAPVVLSNDGSLASALELVAAALSALTSIQANAAAAAAVTAAVNAITSAASAISASAETLPSKSLKAV